MSKRKVLGLAAAALLAFGVQQIAGAAKAAAQEAQSGAPEAQASVSKAVYNERRPVDRHGNVYGAHGVIGHTNEARRGYYGAAGHRPHSYAHHYYRPRAYAGGYYGAARYYPRTYAHRYYPARPVVGTEYYGSTGYYPQYYAHRYYPRPVGADSYYSAEVYAPQYYGQRYYGTGSAVAATSPLGSIFAPTNWSAACVNGRVCTSAYYRGGVPVCRSWAACNY
jgi:hypothetical protein